MGITTCVPPRGGEDGVRETCEANTCGRRAVAPSLGLALEASPNFQAVKFPGGLQGEATPTPKADTKLVQREPGAPGSTDPASPLLPAPPLLCIRPYSHPGQAVPSSCYACCTPELSPPSGWNPQLHCFS